MDVSGSVDTAGLSRTTPPGGSTIGSSSNVRPSSAIILVGVDSLGPPFFFYEVFNAFNATPMAAFGTGFDLGDADIVSGVTPGDAFGFNLSPSSSQAEVYVPAGYVSGTALDSTFTWLNTDFASEGLVLGSYQGAVGATTFDVIVSGDAFTGGGSPAPVPLPAALPLLLAGFGALALVRRRCAT